MRSRLSVLAVVALSVGVSACGGDSGSASTTLAPMESSVFKTIPTTSTTLSPDLGTAATGTGGLDFWRLVLAGATEALGDDRRERINGR